jgi:hypothetical protein
MKISKLINSFLGLKTWHKFLIIAVLVIVLNFLVGVVSNITGSSNIKTFTPPVSNSLVADTGARMACEDWKINLNNSSIETVDQQIAGAQLVNKYASTSEIWTIREYAKKMVEDMLSQDYESYLANATIFGKECRRYGVN